MLRQLLTLLAILTGLVAVAEPVQAARQGSVVESVGQAEPGLPCRRVHVVLQLDEEPRRGRETRQQGCPRTARSIVVVPSVQLQADRAHE